MPKSRKTQPASSKKLRTETPDPVEVEDAITSEVAEAGTSIGTPTSETYVVSDAETASGASSAGEDTFVSPLPVVPLPKGKTIKATAPPRTLPLGWWTQPICYLPIHQAPSPATSPGVELLIYDAGWARPTG